MVAHDVAQNIPYARRRVLAAVVLRQLRREHDLVAQDADLFVRLHNRHLDVERRHLVRDGVAEALEGPGGGGVDRHAGRCDVAANAGEDDDVAVVLCAEERQGSLDEVDVREENSLKLAAAQVEGGRGRREFLDGADDSLGAVAEQDVDAAEGLDRLGEGGLRARHGTAVAPDAADAVVPALEVFLPALALVDEVAELGAAGVVFHLCRWEAGGHIVAVGKEEPDQAHGDG